MKNRLRRLDFLELVADSFIAVAFLLAFAAVIGVPYVHYYTAGVVQKQLNAQCKTNYSRLDVLFAGDRLSQLCRMENQQLTIK